MNLLRGVKKVVTLIFLYISWKVRHLHAETEMQICTHTVACDNGKRNTDTSRTSETAAGTMRGPQAHLPISFASWSNMEHYQAQSPDHLAEV